MRDRLGERKRLRDREREIFEIVRERKIERERDIGKGEGETGNEKREFAVSPSASTG